MADSNKKTDKSQAEKPVKDKNTTDIKPAEAKAPVKKKPKFSLKDKIGRFLRDYKSELKKIVWYGKNQTIKSTTLVIIAIIVSAVFIGVFDFAFSRGLLALGKLI